MTLGPHRAEDSQAPANRQENGRWPARLARFVRLIFTPRATLERRRVQQADALELCACFNHTPTIHRCGLRAVATIGIYGGKDRACEYHARRAITFGLPVAFDDGERRARWAV